MFGCNIRSDVRRLPLSPTLPLGYLQRGVVCTSLGFINEIDQCVKPLCSPLGGGEGAREATAGVFVHTHARGVRMVAVWER